jgi:two-component system sensor histidine kinase DegS
MADPAETGIESFEQFLDACSEKREHTQLEIKEIELLVQQTTAEVERLAQRNTQVTNRLRQIEAGLDTVPREDIREAYSAVLDTQQRLFTMQGQLEKLQSNQRHMARYLELLRGVSEYTDQGAHELQSSDEGEPSQPLVVRIIEAQERERQQLSRQMHDTRPERARAELANLTSAVAGTFQKVKGFILNLRPMMLDDLGVVPTLRRYVDSFSDNSGVRAQLTVTGKERRLASHREVTIFRLVQQLLNNAVDYGHASNVQINLDIGNELARVAVEDNGSGFELTEPLTSPDLDRLGLATMRERVEMLGGQIRFDSGPGKGTKVSFDLPVS